MLLRMSETRPPTPGQQTLIELSRAAFVLADTDNERLTAIADVLQAFLNDYGTETDQADCPSCGKNCDWHPLETYHKRCGDAVEKCICIQPYLRLARVALT